MNQNFDVPPSRSKNVEYDGQTLILSTPVHDDLGNEITPQLRVKLRTTLCTVTGGHNIDEQPINGMNGTIKTHVSMKPYQVEIKGLIVKEPFGSDKYPFEDVEDLTEILRYNGRLEVQSDYLLIFGIYALVVYDYGMNLQEGTSNVQPFTINCVSDRPIELIQEI